MPNAALTFPTLSLYCGPPHSARRDNTMLMGFSNYSTHTLYMGCATISRRAASKFTKNSLQYSEELGEERWGGEGAERVFAECALSISRDVLSLFVCAT